MSDPVSPSHYSRFAIQPVEFIVKNGLDFLAGNVIKYVCRYDAKNGLEDLKKARSYIDKMIAREEEKQDQEGRRRLREYVDWLFSLDLGRAIPISSPPASVCSKLP